MNYVTIGAVVLGLIAVLFFVGMFVRLLHSSNSPSDVWSEVKVEKEQATQKKEEAVVQHVIEDKKLIVQEATEARDVFVKDLEVKSEEVAQDPEQVNQTLLDVGRKIRGG